MKKLETYSKKLMTGAVKLYLADQMRSGSMTKESISDAMTTGMAEEYFIGINPSKQLGFIDSYMAVDGDIIPETSRDDVTRQVKKKCLDHHAKNDIVLNRVIAREIGYTGSAKNIETEYKNLFKKGRLFFNSKKVKTQAFEVLEFMTKATNSMYSLTGKNRWFLDEGMMKKILDRKDYNSGEMKANSVLTGLLGWTAVIGAAGIVSYRGHSKARTKQINDYFTFFNSQAEISDSIIKSVYATPEEIAMDKEKVEEEDKKIKKDLGEILNET